MPAKLACIRWEIGSKNLIGCRLYVGGLTHMTSSIYLLSLGMRVPASEEVTLRNVRKAVTRTSGWNS